MDASDPILQYITIDTCMQTTQQDATQETPCVVLHVQYTYTCM